MEAIKQHGGFKARKLNIKVIKGVTGVPKVEKMPVTTDFKEFKLGPEKKSGE